MDSLSGNIEQGQTSCTVDGEWHDGVVFLQTAQFQRISQINIRSID